MNNPLSVTVDPDYPVGYVMYRTSKCDGSYRLLREPDGRIREYGYDDGRDDEGIGVVVDLNASDQIVGLEIIEVDDPELLGIARDYARAHGLTFPADLRTAARALVR